MDDQELIDRIFGNRGDHPKDFLFLGTNMKVNYGVTTGEIGLDYGIPYVGLTHAFADGYIHGINAIKYKRALHHEIIANLQTKFGLKFHDVVGGSWKILVNDQVMVYINSKQIVFLAKTHEDLTKLSDFIKDYLLDDDSNVDYYYVGPHGLQHESITVDNSTLKIIPELYPTIDINILREQFAASPERILIFYGLPGVGKTTFLKYLIGDDFYKKAAYIKDKKTFEDSALWYQLTDSDYDLIIFDDLDDILQSRGNNKNADFVSNLLSYSDGLIYRKTKIVITTNQSVSDIDPALIRHGRCFDFLVLPPLNSKQAYEIWVNILKQSPESYKDRFGETDEITQATLMSEYHQIRINMTERNYIKHGPKNYSIRQKLEELGISSGSRHTGFRG